jgi:glycosyltransferase involved in cell wall biosynthesis
MTCSTRTGESLRRRSAKTLSIVARIPARLRTLYICYLSIEDPLVHTQVVAYLAGLVERGHTIHLLTFDPKLDPERHRAHREQLSRLGIEWHSLRYHKRPSLPATVYDTLAGAIAAAVIVRRNRLDALHARNHVPAAMALMVRRLTRGRLIFDIRGLMAQEYVDAGRWRSGGIPYRLTNWIQRLAIRRADGVVMLTNAARGQLFGNPSSRDSVVVIPCCADLERIEALRTAREETRRTLGLGTRPVMLYVGKVTGRYSEREMVQFFVVAKKAHPGLAFLALTQVDPMPLLSEFERAGIPASDYVVTRAEPDDVGRYLAAADFAVFFYRAGPSQIAVSPTKIGEYLGAGLPVICSADIGDTDELLTGAGVGAVLGDFSQGSYEKASAAIGELLADPAIGDRCRAIAQSKLSLRDVGIPRYDHLYRRMAGP